MGPLPRHMNRLVLIRRPSYSAEYMNRAHRTFCDVFNNVMQRAVNSTDPIRIYKLEQSLLLSKFVGCSSFYWSHSEQRGSVVGAGLVNYMHVRCSDTSRPFASKLSRFPYKCSYTRSVRDSIHRGNCCTE